MMATFFACRQRRSSALLSVVLGALFAANAHGTTTIEDYNFFAGKIRPVIGVRSGNNHWSSAQFKMALGMERTPGSKRRGVDGYSVVLDASQMNGLIPAICVQRFAQSWNAIRQQFPSIPGYSKKGEHPPEEDVWAPMRTDTVGQRIEFIQNGCSVKLWAGRAIPYSAPPDDRGGDFKRAFPGLSMKNGTRELKLGRVEFVSEGKKVAISFVSEHDSIPGLE